MTKLVEETIKYNETGKPLIKKYYEHLKNQIGRISDVSKAIHEFNGDVIFILYELNVLKF
jgi:hypothetical protein